MKQLQMGVAKFPDLYVCETNADIELAKKHGLPYLVWKTGDHDKLVKLVLYRLVKKMMPEIDWAKLWGITNEDLRWCKDGSVIHTMVKGKGYREFSVDKYLVSKHAAVNIEELEALHLLPKFLGDITDCIRQNITDYTWHDGRNKKTGIWMGNYVPQQEAGNLIILDISASIPVGISSVMLRLIDTIRHKCNAELIITGGTSRYWSITDELPTPQQIRDEIPRSNESYEFQEILKAKVAGRHWGNIISFGDDDNPWWSADVASILIGAGIEKRSRLSWYVDYTNQRNYGTTEVEKCMQGTIIDNVMHYHTRRRDTPTGYAYWTKLFNPKESFDTSWCEFVERGW